MYLTTAKGEAKCLDVGRAVDEVRASIETAVGEGKIPRMELVEPGQNAWWDLVAKWPPATKTEREAAVAPGDGSSALAIAPLKRDTWAPHLASPLFLLHVFLLNPQKRLRGLLRPRVLVRFDDDFSPLEREEIADALEGPLARFEFDEHVAPRPITDTARQLRLIGRVVMALLIGATIAMYAIAGWVGPYTRWKFAPFAVALPAGYILSRREKALRRIYEGEAPRRMGRLTK